MFATIVLSLLLAPRALFTGPELDYQPAIVEHNGALIIVFERLASATFSGDLYVTRSTDGGATWSEPAAIVATTTNERAPALVHLGDGIALFYIAQSASGFRIHRATSTDCVMWSTHGAIDLGWTTAGEINPHVIREADGSLTMTYHRINGPSYIARSTDGGESWDWRRTQVSESNAALPRITKRESDGLYLVTYQVNPGNNALRLFSKTSKDPYDWSATASPVSIDGNSHDSQPYVLANGTFNVVYADARGLNPFHLYRRWSVDGRTWSEATALTSGPAAYDVQPHTLAVGERRLLLWSRQKGASGKDHDLWLDTSFGTVRRRAVKSQ